MSLYLVASLTGHAPALPPSPLALLKRALPSSPDSNPSSSTTPPPPPTSHITERGGPTSIPITSSLPDPSGLSPRLSLTWDTAFSSLSSTATRLISRKTPVIGIPGTRATTVESARVLQSHLDCMAGQGEWVREPTLGSREASGSAGLTVHKHSSVLASCDKRFYKSGHQHDASEAQGWDVRESLKWRWVPSSSCALPGSPSSAPAPLTRKGLCTLLAHKSTLLVGDTLQYSLHDLILDWTSTEPQSCYGDLYCKEHALCGDILRAKSSPAIEDWSTDERVYNRLPSPPPSSSSSSHNLSPRADAALSPALDIVDPVDAANIAQQAKAKSISYGTMLRYRRSDGLQASSRHTIPTYIHPSTGIREINQQFLAETQRVDIVILTKAPLPLPLRGHNLTWDAWWDANSERADERIVEAAWRFTEDVWLPELVATLSAVRAGRGEITDQLVVYRGGWRTHHDCASSSPSSSSDSSTSFPDWHSPGDGPPPHPSQPSLRQLLFRTATSSSLNNPHALFSTLQTILQNHVVRTIIAPAFGIAFLDLESTLSVWRSGMLGGSAADPFDASTSGGGFVDQSGAGNRAKGLRSSASGDCQRYCVPSPGMAIEEAFLGGLMRVLQKA
ncbi:hypothetical protein RQP46_001473 [Phenoliferia psychrophenolica]